MRRLILFAFICGTCASQTPQPSRITLKPGAIIRPQPPEPEPGDKAETDPVTGDLVITSRGVVRRIVKRTGVRPEITAKFERTGAGVKYTYMVTNRPDARQYIFVFGLEVLPAPALNPVSPAYWGFVAHHDPYRAVLRASWGRRGADNDDALKLLPGTSAGPFSFESEGLPGLIKARFEGFKPFPAAGTTSDEIDEPYFGRQSAWALAAPLRELGSEKNSVLRYTVGPKVGKDANAAEAVRADLLSASQLPEFAALSEALKKLSAENFSASLRMGLVELQAKTSGLPQVFLSAMIFTLDARPY